jgi:AcrR family transcriptional regulator
MNLHAVSVTKIPSRETGPTPRWRRRKDARPAEILAAALAEFVERGYSAARLDDIAGRAGVSKGTLYLYFDNKEALFKAMARHNLLPTVEAAEELLRNHSGTTRELVADILRIRWERFFNSSSSGLPKLLISEAGNFPDLARWYHDEIITRANATLVVAIERGIERGEFRAVDVPRTVYLAIAPLLIASLWKHSFMRAVELSFSPDEYIENWIDTFLRGIEARPLFNGNG